MSFSTSVTVSNANIFANGLAFGNGRYVLSTNSGATFVSADGHTWASHSEYLHHVTFVNDRFIEPGSLKYSTDGLNWYSANGGGQYAAIAYGNNMYVAIDSHPARAGFLNTSIDGVNWTTGTPLNSQTEDIKGSYDITFGNGTFVSVHESGIAYSTDGVSWTQATSGSQPYYNKVAFGNGIFVAFGGKDSSKYSTDGINWTNVTLPSSRARDAIFSEGRFIMIYGNQINTSVDGINWTSGTNDKIQTLLEIVYDNDKYVLCGHNSSYGVIITTRPPYNDTVLPVITLLGEVNELIGVGETYTDAGATALDNNDGDITANIQLTSSLDTNVPGIYVLTYNVSDAAGNAALPVSRFVNVIDYNTFDGTYYTDNTYGIQYSFSGSNGKVTKYYNNISNLNDVVIQGQFEFGSFWYTVNDIDDSVFENMSNIQSISIPSTITTLPTKCFSNCTNLTTVSFSHLLKVGNETFSGCINLNSFPFENISEFIGEKSFENCTSITKTNLTNAINISQTSFLGCNQLVSIGFGENVTLVPDNILSSLPIETITFYGSTLPIFTSNMLQNSLISIENIIVQIPNIHDKIELINSIRKLVDIGFSISKINVNNVSYTAEFRFQT
jgi:hypothetical protein